MNMRNSLVLNYLYKISRTNQIIAGQHNQESKDNRPYNPALSTNNIYQITQKYPSLWSGDFLYQQGYTDHHTREQMILEAERQWKRGAIINIMWHACPPTQNEPCQWEGGILSHLSNIEWQSLITDNTVLNQRWKSRLDTIAHYLKYLKKQRVEVLWRPFHEMNQAKFWWGGNPQYIKQLYQITYHYLVKIHGLTNLIWVWNLQDFSSLQDDLKHYNPGHQYWDIASLDIYGSDGQGFFTQEKYQKMLNIAGNKPIAIGECFRLPSVNIINDQPCWTFFMGWGEDVFRHNSIQEIKNVYNASNVLTRLTDKREFDGT